MEDFKYHIFYWFLLLTVALVGCDQKKLDTHANHTADSKDFYYTCSMHPSVRSDKPGNCPICGMKLVKKEAAISHADMLHLTEKQQLVVNLELDTAKIKTLEASNTLLGIVVRDEEQLNVISGRAKGRIEKLYIKTVGASIKKGEVLYSLYSESLSAAESDYIQAIQQKQLYKNQKEVLEQLIQSARAKLLLYGLTEKQILDIEKAGKPSSSLNFYSNTSGILTELKVKEGAYIEEGTPLFEISDLNSVWLEAQAYPQDVSYIKANHKAKVEFETFPEEEFTAELAYIAPQLEENQKISLVRFRIKNSGKIRPGMMAYISIPGKTKEALVVPKSALLVEKMKTIWVETDKGMFERRMVTTGAESKKEVEILSGIKNGEKVVSSGAYLLNSEFLLQKGGNKVHSH